MVDKIQQDALFLPQNTSPEVRKAFISLINRVKSLGETAVTLDDLKDPNFLKNNTVIYTNTDGDKNPPVDPSGLAATKYENRNRLTWTNSTSEDAIGVYVYRSTSGGDRVLVGVVSAPSNRYDDLDVTPFMNYTYYIKAVDDSGNVSNQVPVVDGLNVVSASTLPAPDAVIADAWTQDDVNLSWDSVDGFGVSGYRVEIVNRRTVDVTDPRYTYTLAQNIQDSAGSDPVVNLTVRVWTIGTDGSLSPAYTECVITHALPDVVTGAVAGVADLGFMLSWSFSADPCVVGYDVGLGSDVIETNYAGNSYLYKTLLIMGSYSMRVRARNKFGQVSAWNSQILTVHGPYAPTGLTAKVIDNTVMLYWETPASIELPIVEYEIRRGDLWAPGNVIGRKKGTFTTIQENISGSYQYMVAAVDSAGNVGPCSSITTHVDEPPDFVLNVEWVDDFNGGSPVNVLVLPDGTAIAPCHVGQTWADHFIGNGTKQNPQFRSIKDLIDAGYTYLPEPVPLSGEYSEEHDYGALLKSSSVSAVVDKVDYFGGPQITTYIGTKAAIGDVYTETQSSKSFSMDFRYVRDRYTFVSDGKKFTVLKAHTLRLDSKLRSDTGKDVITDAVTGKAVLFNRPFVDVQSISVTPMGAQPLIAVVDFEDVPYPTGFTVYLFTLSGVAAAAPFSWSAKGY